MRVNVHMCVEREGVSNMVNFHSGHLRIPFNTIKLRNKLGEGGYGTVYLSEINGTFIAVKKVNITVFLRRI